MDASNYINKLTESHKGTQPIRVLQEIITAQFENTYPGFSELTKEVIEKLSLQPSIAYHLNEFPIEYEVSGHKFQTPYVDENKAIHIHETFLSYVWCVSYSLTTLYDLTIYFKTEDFDIKISNAKISKALDLLSYGMSLIKLFSEWDKEALPNPELYSIEDQNSIERANVLFILAMNFILCHEFAHVEKKHIDTLLSKRITAADKLEFEIQADNRAIELMRTGITNAKKDGINIGILVGLSCLLFFQKTTVSQSGTHPDIDTRIHALLEYLKPEATDPLWGIAYLAYKLWDFKFSKSFVWATEFNSPKDLYYHFYNQLQEEKVAKLK